MKYNGKLSTWKNTLVLFSAFLLWLALNTVLYPILVRLILQDNYPVFINQIYFFFIYILLGLLLGWTGKSVGWLLALVFGVAITIFFIFVSLQGNFLNIEIENWGLPKTVLKLMESHALFLLYLVLGSLIGNMARKRRNKECGQN